MALHDISLERLLGSNPVIKELGSFEESLAIYDPHFAGWTGGVDVVRAEVSVVYALATSPLWPTVAVLLVKPHNGSWTIAGACWGKGIMIRPPHRGKGLSYHLIARHIELRGDARGGDAPSPFSEAGYAAVVSAHRRSRSEARFRGFTPVSKSDMAWCEAAADAMIAGRDVEGTRDRFSINRYNAAWTAVGDDPRLAVQANLAWAAAAGNFWVPAAAALKSHFARDPAGREEFRRYLAGVVLHELLHRRQFISGRIEQGAWGPGRREWSAAKKLESYYLNPLEIEAHAAQIARDLADRGLACDEASVFGGPVGSKIAITLDELRGGVNDEAYARFRALLVEASAVYRRVFLELDAEGATGSA